MAVRDGFLPDGECVCTRLDDGTIRIDRADPRILISAEVIDAIIDGSMPAGRLYRPHSHGGHASYAGALIKIPGVNQTVVYRITEYVPAIHGYIAEWPD